MQVMLMRLMSKSEYLIVPKGTKFTGSGKLGLYVNFNMRPIARRFVIALCAVSQLLKGKITKMCRCL